MNPNEIADRNVERLLGQAYRPEPIDPAFLSETEDKLLAAGRSMAETVPQTVTPVLVQRVAPPADVSRLMRVQRRLSWALASAAALAACALAYYAGTRELTPLNVLHQPRTEPSLPQRLAAQFAAFVGQTAKPRPETPKPPQLAAGGSIATGPGQRRRVSLDDGSIVYVNENTKLWHPAPRRLVLDQGEIYLEVAPRPEGERFIVETPERTITAVGTHFGVLRASAGAGVLVTQGKVKVSDVPGDVAAGQQVAPGRKTPQTAPRATHVLDWTRELMTAADAALVPASKHEGGALIAIDPNGQELQLALRKYHIDVHIEDGFARTTIDQTYFNHTWGRLEGTFYFPLPPDASLSRLAMYVVDGKDCKLNEGGMAERDHARNAYETIRYERRDPALLEWVDGSTFKMRVFPLEAWQEKRIVLSYTQRLPSLYGVQKYRFPGGLNMPVVRDWSFNVEVHNAANWDVLCTSHPEAQRSSPRAGVVTLAHHVKHIAPEQDVTLELREREAPAGGATFATMLHEGQRYFMARYRPKLDKQPVRQRRDWIVLAETSANRDPLLARTQIEVFRSLFKHVEYDDTLTVLTVNSEVQLLAAKPHPATPANVETAVKYLEQAHLVGGCDLERGLKMAVELSAKMKNPHLLHLGAGVGSLGEFKDEVLAGLVPDSIRYIGIGVGKKWNRAFMKLAADRTGGYFTQINPDEPVAWRAFDVLATLNTPRLLDVRVVDPEEKVSYLSDAVMIAQGEEIFAFTRGPADSFFQPKSVIISGRHEGKPIRQELAVEHVAEGAGYLPRTWAKLEIDRLMADGQDKNKAAIVALSKAMYVMSPFTSLLVLENEADYQRFNIDRGRKDHWAMYPSPERIPLVYEPAPQPPWWGWRYEDPKDGKKLPPEQVLDSILVRLPPNVIHTNHWSQHLPAVATARMIGYSLHTSTEFRGEEFLGIMGGNRLGRNIWAERKLTESFNGFARLGELDFAERSEELMFFGATDRRAGARADVGFFMRGGDVLGDLIVAGLDDLNLRLRDPAVTRFKLETFGFGSRTAGGPMAGFGEGGLAGSWGRGMPQALAAAKEIGLWEQLKTKDGLFAAEGMADFEIPQSESLAQWFWPALLMTVGSVDRLALDASSKKALVHAWIAELTQRISKHQDASRLFYDDPRFQPDDRIFRDLVMYAPGLNTTLSDIRYRLDQEAQLEKRPRPGKVDVAARKLVDRARTAGWQTLRWGGDKASAVTITFNGQGQFRRERVYSTGLTEQVVCDGVRLLHLYPELGLVGQRPFHRHYHDELSRYVPWFVPTADDLAWDADVQTVDAHTVALVPHPPRKPVPGAARTQLHLVFSAAGPLAEIRWVAMPAEDAKEDTPKVLARQTFGADGVVRVLDAEGKTLQERQLDVQVAQAPNLTPDLAELLVLQLPVRSGHYYHVRMQPRTDVTDLLPDERIGYFAAMCYTQDSGAALRYFAQHHHAKGDRRLGFYTLLTLAGAKFDKEANTWAPGIVVHDVAREHPNSILARYLAHQQRYQHPVNNLDAEPLQLGSQDDGFIARLAHFRAAWQTVRFNRFHGDEAQKKRQMVLDFAKQNRTPLRAFAVMHGLNYADSQYRGEVAAVLADTARAHADPLGIGYALDYQAAIHQTYRADYVEASRRFRELYLRTLAAGVLPKIQHSFSSALDQASSKGPSFAQFMRDAVGRLVKDQQPHLGVMVALQAAQLGQQSVGDELVRHVQQHAEQEPSLLLAQLEYLLQRGFDVRAETICDQLLENKELSASSAAWRLSAAVAERRDNKQRALAHLEEALEREYRELPELVNLQAVRGDYHGLLNRYLELARAAQTLAAQAPPELTAKVIKAADRWRALDAEAPGLYPVAYQIFKALGKDQLAWAYLTTPLALKPNEAAPWLQTASVLRDHGLLRQADAAYVRAFASETTNPQILWDRAQNLLQMGEVAQARALWQQIAEGAWQERFQQLPPQARWHLEHQ